MTENVGSPALEFSLVRGGPTYAILKRLGLAREDGRDALRQSLAFVAATWGPMLLLGLVEWFSEGHWDPVLVQLRAHVRLVIALPVLILGEQWLHSLSRRCIAMFVDGGFAEQAAVERLVGRAERQRDSRLAEIAVAGLVAVMNGPADWLRLPAVAFEPGTVGSWVGTWYAFVDLPVTQFVFVRWLWRWLVWAMLLCSFSRLPLRLSALHPDRRGGVAFLGEATLGFVPGLVAFNTVQVGMWLDRILREGASVKEFTGSFAALGLLIAIVVVGPLIAWTAPLAKLRLTGYRSIDEFALGYVRAFQRKWLEAGHSPSEALGSSDIQSLADLANGFRVVEEVRILPIDRRVVLALVVSVSLPLVPLLFTELSPAEVVGRLMHAVLGREVGE
jgi:hypothetical protein